MTRRRRNTAPALDAPLSAADLAGLVGRSKWAGILADVPPLSPVEQERLHRAQAGTRTPMKPPFNLPATAHRELWATVDPVHGRAGSSPMRRDDDGPGFCLDTILKLLAADRAAATAFAQKAPWSRQAVTWWLEDLSEIERLARERASDPHPRPGHYYRTLTGMADTAGTAS